ncbi:Wall-associated receptor kinase 2 [Bienertia sinuspersici]
MKMFGMFALSLLSFVVIYLELFTATDATSTTIPLAKPGCPTKCGNVTIPYPFGIGLDGACSLNKLYAISCNRTFYDPPRPFLRNTVNLEAAMDMNYNTGYVEVVDISINGQMRIKNFVGASYYKGGEIIDFKVGVINLYPSPLVFSDTANKLTAIGCDDTASLITIFPLAVGGAQTSACTTVCINGMINGSCTGMGCCESSIPKGLKTIYTLTSSYGNYTDKSVSVFSPYSYAFLAEQGTFTFNVHDLNDTSFKNKTQNNVPVVVDWFVGEDETCEQARLNRSTYVCQNNTNCTDFHGAVGYHCSCSYKCSCPEGHRGDGLKNGTRCTSNHSRFVMGLSLGKYPQSIFIFIFKLTKYFLYLD